MRVTEIHIFSVTGNNNGLVGFANIVMDGVLNLRGIGIYERIDGQGYRLTYPMKGNGYAFHPLTTELSRDIEQAIFRDMKRVMDNKDAGHNCVINSNR
jgi:DNA-binding cell septation regulator SpoVG